MIIFMGPIGGFSAILAIIFAFLSYHWDEKEKKKMDEQFKKDFPEIYGKD